MPGKPMIITGGIHSDARGAISFFNDFQLDNVQRFYLIEPADTDVIRAWQGHRKEQKWFFVVSGKFKVVAVEIDNWECPSADLPSYEFDLSASSPAVLQVPGGYANGFKALEPDSKVMIFSDFSVADSVKDEYRFDSGKWFNW